MCDGEEIEKLVVKLIKNGPLKIFIFLKLKKKSL